MRRMSMLSTLREKEKDEHTGEKNYGSTAILLSLHEEVTRFLCSSGGCMEEMSMLTTLGEEEQDEYIREKRCPLSHSDIVFIKDASDWAPVFCKVIPFFNVEERKRRNNMKVYPVKFGRFLFLTFQVLNY